MITAALKPLHSTRRCSHTLVVLPGRKFIFQACFDSFSKLLCVWGKYLRTYVISLPPPMRSGDPTLAPKENGTEQMIVF